MFAAERAPQEAEPRDAPAGRAATAPAAALASAIGNRAFAGLAQRRLARLPLPIMAQNPITTGVSCFAAATSHTEQFIADLRSSIVYDDETRRYNENEGRTEGDWGMALFDAWGYCYIAACLRRESSELTTWALGESYDAIALTLHEAWEATAGWVAPSQDEDTTTQDRYNRAVGRSIGASDATGDLYQLCFDAMAEGRLDLSAAGVARGRSLQRA
jgi:hypothetical protein